MRDVTWRMGFTLAILALLTAVGANASCRGGTLGEWTAPRTPQAEVTRYLAAVAAGDREQALASWSMDAKAPPALAARRESVTDDLLAYGGGLEYQVIDVELWKANSPPAVVQDAESAQAARVQVVVTGEAQALQTYLFDLLVEEPPDGPRAWIVIDVYPEGAVPLAWPWR